MKLTHTFLLVLTLTSAAVICSDRYQEHPDQEPHPIIKNKDYTNLEFARDWNRDQGYFTVKNISIKEYDEIWQGQTRDFRGDNFYTVSMKGGMDATLAEYAYEAIPRTKAVINYHCSNPKSDKPKEVEFMIYDHNHRVYHEAKNTADVLVIDFKEATDVRIRFSNPGKRRLNCFITSECVECGKFHHRLMNMYEFRAKLDRIGQINRYIGVSSCKKLTILGNYEFGSSN